MNLSVGGDQAINLEDIINEIGCNFAASLNNSLAPIVDRANSIERNYRAISESLRKMPEFRDLVSENEELKKELIEFRSSYAECPGVTLEVTEKAGGHEDTNAIVEQVYTDADLPPYGATTGSLLSSNGLYSAGDENSSTDDEDYDTDHSSEYDGAETLDVCRVLDKDNTNDESDMPLVARSVSSVVKSNDEDNDDSSKGNESDGSDNDDENDSMEDASEEVYLVEIHGKGAFYTNDESDGIIYTIEDDDEIGERVGIFKDGIEVFD